ncbi:MAG: quinolinate synthase NadA [Clostridiales bacterium]|nr:quinolinate synthase NadA [Clostridiales bacterium]
MNTRELQDAIMEAKKKNDVCILAHAYQSQDIWDVADYIGDSYGLSVQASKAPQKTIIMSGVRFMAETVKMLSPEKKVLLANPLAGCPMAAQMDRDDVLELRKEYPEAAIVAYINTTSDLKRAVDVVVTSSSAVKILKQIPNKQIVFIPDCNLGSWCEEQLPEKEFIFVNGGCPTHMRMIERDVKAAKAAHPQAEVLVHPEVLEEVRKHADYIGSTTGIMKYAEESSSKEFIIGTEHSIVQHLQFKCPDKQFYPLSKECVCHNMALTTLMDIYRAVNGTGGEEITLFDQVREEALKPIEKMVAMG